MNRFYKVTREQYNDAVKDNPIVAGNYDDIKLPTRATTLSAGYDFYLPIGITLGKGALITIPTGVGIELDEDKFLMCLPRSGLGFKYKLHLANTAAVIDADFRFSDNGGHIMAKLCNEGDRILEIKKGQAFMQGIIIQYFKTEDDNATGIRNGGFGSTDKKGGE